MNEENATAPSALINLLKSPARVGSLSFIQVVLYTSFGVVRGGLGNTFEQEMATEALANVKTSREVIELKNVSIEHYSNHLPNASFNSFYVSLDDVQGFSLS